MPGLEGPDPLGTLHQATEPAPVKRQAGRIYTPMPLVALTTALAGDGYAAGRPGQR